MLGKTRMLAHSSPGNAEPVSSDRGQAVLLCRVGLFTCALPLEHVSETMRPQPFEPLSGTAPFVDGVSVIRGDPVPVVDLARLLGSGTDELRTRLVLVKVGQRCVALSVGSVIGVRALESSVLNELPPLLGGASAQVVVSLGSLDARLLLLLETSRIVPDASWATLSAHGVRA